ncbi:hypothetical protein [Maribacter sp. HTCC2170]|uniref:hypothetical protein n=1 Tax=Maribacter sp. (strain HTCC2170 / KCCM 42371) TaxID=313603 RepID=UPI0002F2E6AE|nr:hypothetical protein [Maribacter sp. HTCC2170]
MVIEDYKTLSIPEQWFEVFGYGRFLITIQTPMCNYSLYSLHSFFVEVVSDPLSNNPISSKPFCDGSDLEKYINDFDVKCFESL